MRLLISFKVFKSHHGLDATETPREVAFCAHAIHQETVFEIKDSRTDERFHDNPLVTSAPNVIFYAGAPLITPEGYKIGTICVIDNKPSSLNETQKEQLRIIAQQIVAQLELRKSTRVKEELFAKLMSLTKKISQRNVELNSFTMRAAHDLDAPIRQIRELAQYCLQDIDEGEVDDVSGHLNQIVVRSEKLRGLIQDVFALTRAEELHHQSESINFETLIVEALESVADLALSKRVEITHQIKIERPFISERIRLQQILYNLISNAVKYSDPDKAIRYVKVAITDNPKGVEIVVTDNGLGITDAMKEKVFKVFERFHPDVAEGSGLGLNIVQKHVEALSGEINFSGSNEGTEFRLVIPSSS